MVSLVLLVLMTSSTLYEVGDWDFWEHSAVVKELATHPLSPQHPLFKLNEPHAFYSPYLLFVGLLARLSSLNPIDALAMAGLFNLLLFLISFRLFIHYFFNKFHDAIAFYGLILILFLWPASALDWSGFIHFKILRWVLPYPSTFVIGLTFLIFSLYHFALNKTNRPLILLTGLLLAVAILTHPPTAVVTCIGILAISLHFYNIIGFRALLTGWSLLIGVVTLVFLWPYFSFLELRPFYYSNELGGYGAELEEYRFELEGDDLEEYSFELEGDDPLPIWYTSYAIWPTLFLLPFALPLLIARLRVNQFDAFFFMLCGVALTYGLGYFVLYFANLEFLGRTISFVAIFVQIALAGQLAQLETDAKAGKLWASLPVMILIGVTLCAVALNAPNKLAFFDAWKGIQGLKHRHEEFERLGRHVEQYDVILSDIDTSWKIPAFAGKVLAASNGLAFIEDHGTRGFDQKTFFSKGISPEVKFSILKKYQVDYIFINKISTAELQTYFNFGNLVYETKNFLLIKTFLSNGKDSGNIQ